MDFMQIVYSPLNGTGLKPVLRTLKETGYTNITVVKEQENPDGNFPTCPYPNPEIKEAMALGMEYAKKCNADLLLATDPDCDRVGIAVKNAAGEYVLLSGNETGMLLLNYAVNGAYLICEMFAYYKTQGISLIDKLNSLYEKYGYCLNTLHSYEFDGSAGFAKMQDIMAEFHKGLDTIGGKKVIECQDYSKGLNGLPKSDVLKFMLEGNCSVVVRPSGTEPKLKTYISVSAVDRETAEKEEQIICDELAGKFM